MSQIAEIQRALSAAGFNPGPVDGAWGPRTRSALIAWQKQERLTVTGQIDAVAVSRLLGSIAAPLPIVWLDEATRLLGLKEGPGAKNNQTILDWADDLDLHYPDDSVAWCGLFAAHVARVALPDEPLPANPLGARNFLKFGVKVEPQVGAFGVFWRGTKAGWLGHIGLLVAESPKAYCVRGGNQSDSVSDAWIAKDRLLEARWPSTGPKSFNRKLPAKPAGLLSTNEA